MGSTLFGRLRPLGLAAAMVAAIPLAQGAAITVGAPFTALPAALIDPLGSLSMGLQFGQFLVPIQVSGAQDLQDWSFDLPFDADLVTPLDVGGLYGAVYAAWFSDDRSIATEITSNGFLFGGALQSVAGFVGGANGNGVLAYVLFESLSTHSVALPGTLALASAALVLLCGARRGRPRPSPAIPDHSSAQEPIMRLPARPRTRLATAMAAVLALVAAPASAQLSTTANGPYYAVPAWSQKLNAQRFVVLANWNNEAVLDRETGLVWERNPEFVTHTWSGAHIYCIRRTVGGRKGWRLPSVQELMSLQDPAATFLSLPPGHPFNNVVASDYWSATRFVGDSSYAWQVTLNVGNAGPSTLINEHFVWCVRGGPAPDAQ